MNRSEARAGRGQRGTEAYAEEEEEEDDDPSCTTVDAPFTAVCTQHCEPGKYSDAVPSLRST